PERDVRRLIRGTRASRLARWQTDHVADLLRQVHGPDLQVEIEVFSTRGDQIQDKPLPEIGAKGLFTAELEEALSAGRIDAAVHSLKDLPTDLPPGLEVVAIPPRADPRDGLVLRGTEGAPDAAVAPGLLDGLPLGGTLGTGSVRRAAQARLLRPDLQVKDLRGNVPTRIRKLEEGQYDGIILACAGLERLGLSERIARCLDLPWLPAPGQGAIAVEGSQASEETVALLAAIDDPLTRLVVTAERELLAQLEGGCSVPVGALARLDGAKLQLQAALIAPDGSRSVPGSAEGPADLGAARELGRSAAEQILRAGGRSILEALAGGRPR
ncbi:MAG: hydroxymethylbilane synthase, partial [Myxococcota bacterium]|nr:hydroxymethylbilane synthase [Myxococcota bacterium]